MKHPALARVFAIVLALLSSFMLINGALGFGKADGTLQESLEYCQRVEDKLAEYEELDAKLENSISYDEAYEELERLQDEHDEEAAQHRTDLATHTATMGGYTMGVDMIMDGREQLNTAKQELESGKQQLEQQETLLNQSIQEFNNGTKPELNALKDAMSGPSTELQSSAVKISALAARLDAYIDSPTEPGGDEGGDQTGGGTDTGDGGDQTGEGGDQTGEGGDQTGGDSQTGGGGDQTGGEGDTTGGGGDTTGGGGGTTGGEGDTTGGEGDQTGGIVAETLSCIAGQKPLVARTLGSVSGEEGPEVSGGVDSGYAELITEINAQLAAVRASAIGVIIILGQSSEIAEMIGLSAITIPEDFTEDSDPAEVQAQLLTLATQLGTAASIPTILDGLITQTEAQLQEGQEALEKAKRQLAAGEETLKKSENELQHQLELLWYNMGQLDDEAEELEEDKEKLDNEADMLDKMLVSVDELKELEDSRRSARIILMQEDEIEAMVNDGGDLGESTRSFLEQQRSSAQYDHWILYVINTLAVVGGVLGILCIPGSYELLRSRLLLIAPPLLCLLCAAAAYGLNLYHGLGQMYTALFAAMGALFHLVIVIPRNKPVSTVEISGQEAQAPAAE